MNEERIFPFYRGRCMGKSYAGYSNKKSASKYMMDIPDDDVYEKFGGRHEYVKTHSYLKKLDDSSKFSFNDDVSKSEKYDGPYSRQFNDIKSGSWKDEERVYCKDIPESDLKEIHALLSNIHLYCFGDTEAENLTNIREFQRKWNLFPRIYIDDVDFKKMRSKIKRDEVVYKKCVVTVDLDIKSLE